MSSISLQFWEEIFQDREERKGLERRGGFYIPANARRSCDLMTIVLQMCMRKVEIVEMSYSKSLIWIRM
jgi:hypothetical protein